MFGLGVPELIVIGVILVFIFGAKRLPGIGKGIGEAIREFRKIKGDVNLDDENRKPGEMEEKSSLEKDLSQKVIEEVPALRKGRDAKKKVEKTKKIIT